ncbi:MULTISPECIES: aromatic ring-hydroxylating dioxygenase subunit alpha [unclassified Acinetobacter]|uniref:aromatic ring-hydroxylating dioxygenase subunit alpha n=1 Tax=unclassified Acinetobacter TaxID=196816 RepID=UPI00190E3FE4|nr:MULTISPECIES: aromatic ring-hydroxylating dioxygenase subunit alpha [unclassified Acinetobacter]MBK0065194.1 aromatic ring-hydroxylating dioxygenase subunit alpha [Acinetobacter sp. S55]MBK0068433.1 aromatic ring-hydroxylating dioxygenase subunit alpha [Acinetobacter sp. S54]
MPNTQQYSQMISSSLLGEWIVVASEQEFVQCQQIKTCLDGQTLSIHRDIINGVHIYQVKFDSLDVDMLNLAVQVAFGFVWLCVGTEKKPLFQLDEYEVAEARRVPCGAYGVRTSPLRGIENFLDMAHFPYVHTGILGAEPETAVKPYQVEWREDVDEIWATECFFTQPLAAPSSPQPQETEYVYRVASPLNAILYKVNTAAEGIIPADVVCLFIQPLSETHIRAHLLMILDDQTSSMTDMVLFQQKIFTQDKPILENHVPLKLPLEKLEIPTKADALATAYRKWLITKNWSYGVHKSMQTEQVV